MKCTQMLALDTVASISPLSMLSVAHADSHKEDTAAIVAHYAASNAAMNKRDPYGTVAFEAPDFTSYDEDGKPMVVSKTDDLEQEKYHYLTIRRCHQYWS